MCTLTGFKKFTSGVTSSMGVTVLPSRSALSDLGLIADLFEKNLLNWSFLPKKSVFRLKKPKKSDFHSSSLLHKAKKNP